jgi:hypothetical protein
MIFVIRAPMCSTGVFDVAEPVTVNVHDLYVDMRLMDDFFVIVSY